MSKAKHERALADNEAKAVARMLRVSPQKLNLLAGLIRGKKAAAALADLERWSDHGIRVHTVLDAEYPANLRAAPDRPPMIFVDGEYEESDARSVAVIGSRSASPAGIARARAATLPREIACASNVLVPGGRYAVLPTVAATFCEAPGASVTNVCARLMAP